MYKCSYFERYMYISYYDVQRITGENVLATVAVYRPIVTCKLSKLDNMLLIPGQGFLQDLLLGGGGETT